MTSSASSRALKRWQLLLGSVPTVTLGLLIVTMAMLQAPWPSDLGTSGGVTVSYADRLQGEQPQPVADSDPFEKTAAWYGRRMLDGLALVLVILAYISLTLMILLGEWRALLLLSLLGGAGILYGGSIGLVLGPILTTGGSAMVLFGAGLNVISQYAVEANDHEITQIERESTYDTHFAPQP